MTETRSPAHTAHSVQGFWFLFATQFQGAFSDNVFKFLAIFLVSDLVAREVRDQYISVVLAVFSLPFILFSMAGGYLADRFSKRQVVIATKIAEVAIMTLGTVALVTQNFLFLVVVLFLMSTQSAFFGPSKYGLLPELLPESRLAWGNGFLGLGTFLAIITGGVVAGMLYEALRERQFVSGLVLIGLAGLGLCTSLGISRVVPADPQKRFRANLLMEVWTNLRHVRGDRLLGLAILGAVYFWFLGALFGEPTIFIYSQDVLRLSETHTAMMRACLAIGIAVGSAAAGILSGRKIEYGLVPLGAWGLSACAGLLAWPGLGAYTVAALLWLLGFFGGFYIVPVNALIQHRPDPRVKGSVIATNAWLTSVAIFLASGVFWVLRTGLRLEPGQIFLVGAINTLLATGLALWLRPDALLRVGLWALTHSRFRLRVVGPDNIPPRGGVVLLTPLLDLTTRALLQAATDRTIRFLIPAAEANQPTVKLWARLVPLLMTSPPGSGLMAAKRTLQTIRSALQAGDLVCLPLPQQNPTGETASATALRLPRWLRALGAPVLPAVVESEAVATDNPATARPSSARGTRFLSLVTVKFGVPLEELSDQSNAHIPSDGQAR